jgi:hypothetical protein
VIPTVARVNVPFRWSIADGLQGQSMIARSYGREIAAVISRPTRKFVPDRNGLLVPYNLGSVAVGVHRGETSALFEAARTNLCIRSEEINSWTDNASGSTVTTNVIAAPDGNATMDLLSGDGTVTSQGRFQTVSFTGNGEKAFSVFLREGTGVTTVRLYAFDSTAGVVRHEVRVTWVAGMPVLSTLSGAGSLFVVEPYFNFSWRVSFSATGIIAANTNTFVIVTADATAAAGSVGVWGAQVENAAVPSSYIPTTSATVTRSADSCYFDLPACNPPRAMTVYARGIERGTRLESGAYIWQISLNNANPRVHLNRTSGTAQMQFQTVTGVGAFSTVSRPTGSDSSVGDLTEYRSILSANGTVGFGATLNAGSELVATPVAGSALEAAWSGQRLYLGTNGGGAAGLFAFTHLVIAEGERTRAEMRELAGV